MPQLPTLDGNTVGTAARRPNYERPLDVSQGEREATSALVSVGNAVDLVDERIAQDDALRAQAAITQEYAAFNAKERVASQGRNADGHVARVTEWWDKTASEYSGALAPRSARIVNQQLLRARTASLADASVYQAGQLNASHVEAFGLAQKALVGRAIAEANDAAVIAGPGGAAQAARMVLLDMQTNTENFAKVQGKGEDWVRAQMLAAATDVHAEVISSLEENDPAAAAAYYRAHKEQIDPRLYDTLEKGIRKASAANDATAAVDQAWAQLGPKNYNDPVPTDKMAAEIRTLFKDDPDRRKMALAELNERTLLHNKAQAEFSAANTNGALGVYQRTRSLGQVEKSIEYLALAPKDQLQVSNYITNLQASQLAKQEAALNRDEAAIRRQAAQQLRTFAPYYNAVSDPEVLSSMTRQQVAALEVQIGPAYVQQLLQRYDSITRSETKLAEAKVDREDMLSVLGTMGLDPKTKKKDQQAVVGETMSRMERAVADAQLREKRPLTREEKNAVMRGEAARTVLVAGSWFGSDEVPVATLTAEQLDRVKLPTNAKAVNDLKAKLSALYAASGDPQYEPTEANLRRLYLQLSPAEGGVGSSTARYITAPRN